MAETDKNVGYILKAYPKGIPTLSNFQLVDLPYPPITVIGDRPEDIQPKSDLGEDEIVIKPLFYCMDAYLRLMLAGDQTPFPVNPGQVIDVDDPIHSGCVGEVLASRCPQFKAGDLVRGIIPWQRYVVFKFEKHCMLAKKPQIPEDINYTAALSTLGMAGISGYFGLLEYGKPKKDDTILISNAQGATGIVVGQIAKIYGCNVIGVVPPGGAELRRVMMEELQFDGVVEETDSLEDMKSALSDACPNGIDIYFDSAGGIVSDAATILLNEGARFVLHGQESLYNAISFDDIQGPRMDFFLAMKRVEKVGFRFKHFREKWHECTEQLLKWVMEGKLVVRDTEVEGFENLPTAFLDMAARKPYIGKLIVKV